MVTFERREMTPEESKALLIRQNREVFPPLDTEFAASLGRVCSEWARVEAQLAHAIGFMLGLDGRGLDAVTRALQIQARIDLASSLVQLIGDDLLTVEWKAVEGLINEVRPKRNEAIHSVWEASGSDGQIWGQPVRGDVRIVRGVVSAADLTTLWDEMTYLAIRIAKLTRFIVQADSAAKLRTHTPPGFNPDRHILAHKLGTRSPDQGPGNPEKP